jgi:hypothetical protein
MLIMYRAKAMAALQSQRTTLRATLASLALLSFVTSAGAATINDDRGGLIRNYLDRWAEIKSSGEKLILDGLCLSACTMFTSLPNTCITEKVILGFHQGTNPRATRTMRLMWPERLKQLVDSKGELAPHEEDAYTLLYYEDLKEILPVCPGVPIT